MVPETIRYFLEMLFIRWLSSYRTLIILFRDYILTLITRNYTRNNHITDIGADYLRRTITDKTELAVFKYV